VQTFQIIFGKRVRYFRKRQKWSQEKLAEKTGLSRERISKIETGKSGTHFQHVDSIVRAFDVPFNEFFNDFEKDPPPD